MNKNMIVSILSIIFAMVISWIDTSPGWDDTAVTVGMVILSAAVCGALSPKYAFVWGLIIGGGLLAANVYLSGNYQSSVAVIFAVAGSYAGRGMNKLREKMM